MARKLLVALLLVSLHARRALARWENDRYDYDDDDCSPGFYSNNGRKPGNKCPPGTFAAVRGCKKCCTCCAGWYQNEWGKGECKRCPNNKPYSQPGATSVNQCYWRSSGWVNTCNMYRDQCPPTGPPVPTPGRNKRAVPKHNCQQGHKNCPVYGAFGKGGALGYECVDVERDLESCGGCVDDDSPVGQRNKNGGRDCSAIPHAEDVRCHAGRCVIERCSHGFEPTRDADACAPARTEDVEMVVQHAASLEGEL